jgi:ubiquinone/menaquinone biosynthesis C-methylase UbiE
LCIEHCALFFVMQRTYASEILDREVPEQPVVDEIYRYLASVNRYLGGVRATIARFEAFSRSWQPGERIEVLDVASGAADLPRALVAWGRHRGFRLRVTATDLLPAALDYARRAGPRDERLRLVCADVERLPFAGARFDYVTCGLFFHHLQDDQIVAVLRTFDRLASRGIVVNDLVRSRRAWIWSWILTWPFHPILHHDGPLSVRRALRPDEMRHLAGRAGLPWLRVRRHFGHRMTLAGERPPQENRPLRA